MPVIYVDKNKNKKKITSIQKSELLDFCHPVEEVFSTVNQDFDPNITWGGVWEKLFDGVCLISEGQYVNGYLSSIGDVIGNRNRWLTIDNIPKHSHTYSKPSTATDGHTLTIDEMPNHKHIIWNSNAGGPYESENGNVFPETGNSNKSWGYEMLTRPVGGGEPHSHKILTSSANTGDTGKESVIPVDVLQPSLVVAMWKRIE